MRATSVFSGCYVAGRAAALSGVPKSTVYWWAREGIVVPSVSPVQQKLWSYGDLLALRMVEWLRRRKPDVDIRSSPMPMVRRAISLLERHDLSVWDAEAGRSPLIVDRGGRIYVRLEDEIVDLDGATALPGVGSWGLTEAFPMGGLTGGPDLIVPRRSLRIVPGKLAGEPHVVDTRINTLALASLTRDGFTIDQIAEMYALPQGHVADAVSLETQLGSLDLAA